MASKGRPKGTTSNHQFRHYVTEEQRKAFVAWAMSNYKKKPELAKWIGDQVFGKAVQPIENAENKPFMLSFDPAFNAIARATEEDR